MSQPRVHIHASSPDAFFVNSFIIEGERSVVLVDTQFVLSEANALLDKIGQLEKPLASIIITHPHPDHYNGLATVLAKYPGTAVHATAATIASIHETAEPKRAYWTPIVGDNYPQTFAYPNVTVVDGQHMKIDDIDMQVFDLGAAECSDNTMIALPQIDAVIVSDLVYNRVHPWLAEGRTLKWLEALDLAKRRFTGAATFFAGHGSVGNIEMIDNQVTYITTARELVARTLKAEGSVSEVGRMRLLDHIRNLYPNWPLEMIIDMNLVALATELAQG